MGTFVNNDVSPGNTVLASDHNTQGSLLAAVINGGIQNDNIASDAAIAGTKIADDAITAAKIDWASTGANGGIWNEEIGRTTLGSAGDTISVTGIAARTHIKILIYAINTGQLNIGVRFNNDSAANYAIRGSINGAADSTAVSQTSFDLYPAASESKFAELNITNLAAQAKLIRDEIVTTGTSGAGNAPGRAEGSGKWHNTSDQITRVDVINAGTGDFATGSMVVVLGHN